jgi:hypothetical protein
VAGHDHDYGRGIVLIRIRIVKNYYTWSKALKYRLIVNNAADAAHGHDFILCYNSCNHNGAIQ